jgi:hypothetical protein
MFRLARPPDKTTSPSLGHVPQAGTYPHDAQLDYFRIADYSGVGKRHQRTWPWQRLSLVTDAETLQLTLSDSRGNARVHYESRGVFATLTV